MVFTRPRWPTSSRPPTSRTAIRIAPAPGPTSPSACANASATGCSHAPIEPEAMSQADTPSAYRRPAMIWLAVRELPSQALVDAAGQQRTPSHAARRRHGLRRALRQRRAALSFADRARPLDGQLRVRHLRLRLDLGDDPRRRRRPRARRRHHPLRAAIPRERRAGALARRRARRAPRWRSASAR